MADSKTNVYIPTFNQGHSTDKFRDVCGNYWVTPGETPEYGDSTTYTPQMAQSPTKTPIKIKKVDMFKIIPRSKVRTELEGSPYYQINEELEVFAEKSKYGSVNEWVDFISQHVAVGQIFYDYSVKMFTPLSKEEVKLQNASNFVNFYNADFNYNYYARLYEISTENAGTPETFLPNLYFFERNREEENDVLFEALTAGGQVAPAELASLRNKTHTDVTQGAYFNSFAKVQGSTPTVIKDKISQKSSNIIFDKDISNINKQATEDETIFPMSVDIKFISDPTTEFAQVLEDSKLTTSLLSYLSLIPSSPTPDEQSVFSIKPEALKRYHEVITAPTSLPSAVGMDFENLIVPEIDVDKWYRQGSNKRRMNSKRTSFITSPDDRRLSKFEKTMYSIIFSGKMRTMAKKHQRSYTSISDGDFAYSETVCYRIDKFLTNGSPFQTIWLPNSNTIDVVQYIDTQVKYNKKYTYRVTAYQFVIGTQYAYTSIEYPQQYGVDNSVLKTNNPVSPVSLSDKSKYKTAYANQLFQVAKKSESVSDAKYFRARIKVESQPCIKIIPLPMFEVSGRVLDMAPVPPHVDPIPYKGIKNKMLFNLNTSVGRYQMDPVIIDERDRQQATALREAQGLTLNEKITYQTDDPLKAFQVYRSSTPPQTMMDFQRQTRAIVSTDVNARTIQKSSAASFVDTLEPNTAYYYMFRSIDIHNKVSNPTPVYKIELVENDGAVFPLVEIYEMSKNKPQKTAKTAKKLFNIVPRLTQTIINNSKSNLGDGSSAFNAKTVMLGQHDSPLFGERFKIRLISKKTGKKMDLNINFKVETEQK